MVAVRARNAVRTAPPAPMRSRGPIPTACRARRTDWSGIDDELRLVIIDVPQLVDLASNPNTFVFLQRLHQHGGLVHPRGA